MPDVQGTPAAQLTCPTAASGGEPATRLLKLLLHGGACCTATVVPLIAIEPVLVVVPVFSVGVTLIVALLVPLAGLIVTHVAPLLELVH